MMRKKKKEIYKRIRKKERNNIFSNKWHRNI